MAELFINVSSEKLRVGQENYRFMGERRELNPRMVDSQSTALIHLATFALYYV